MSYHNSTMDTAELTAQGAALHQAGQLDEAAKIYNEILARSPHDFDATHLLGVIALQKGEFAVAQRLINSAVAARPHEAAAVGNLGVSYLRDGQLEPALRWFEIALRLQPDSPAALINAAEAMHHMGRYSDALPLLRNALAIDPSSYSACSLLGACLMRTGDAEGAARLFEAATQLRPDDAESWANLSVALTAIGQNERAGQCESRAASLQPNSPAALDASAKAKFEQARIADAAESYRRGLSAAPPSVDMLLSYSHTLMANGLIDEALEQLNAASALDRNNLTVRWALAIGQLKPVYGSEPEVFAARRAFAKSLDDIKRWYENTPHVAAPYRTVGTVQPFYLTYQHYNNRELLKKYGALCATFMGTLPRRVPGTKRRCADPVDPPAGRKLRLGVVSAHIRDHSVWNAVTKGWLQNLDRTRFDIQIFHLSATVDPETEAAMASVDHFDNRPKDVAGWVEAIVARELDVILYPEIIMDPLTVQLASLRLAPVQAVSWGHPETSGLPTVDLYLSARAFEPPGAAENNYSEKLIMLPNLSVYLEPLNIRDADPELGSLRLPANEPLLLCPGQPFKYAPQYDEVWVQIARGLQRRTVFRKRSAGRLVFFRSHDNVSDRTLEKRLRAAFGREAVDFDAHVSIIPFLDHERFFGLMRRSALMLDTLGFSGFNTALRAIECDLPVLAFEGEFLRARLASAIMHEIELPELVATSAGDFVQKAVALAKRPDRLAELRAKIIERRSGLFRNLRPVRALERCLIEAAANLGPPLKAGE
jgi:predicted O-linked N-acetylglucosamine transferase (SPINDLY family)